MDERKTAAEPEGRRKKPENPLLHSGDQKNQKKTGQETRERAASRRTPPGNAGRNTQESVRKENVYKLRILTIILVLLIIALIAAFVSEIGVYGRPDSKIKENTVATPVQTEQVQKTDAADKGGPGEGGSLAGL